MVLSVDTSSPWMNLAVTKGAALVCEFSSHQVYAHARVLLPAMEAVLSAHELSLSAIDAFGVCLGPGSFTGLRVGITTVKGLAYSLEKPCVGVSSTELLARGLSGSGLVGCAIDAKKGEVFMALYRCDGKNVVEVKEPFAAAPEVALEGVSKSACGELVTLVGSAVPLYSQLLEERFSQEFAIPGGDVHRIRGSVLGAACATHFAAGRTLSSGTLEPVYARAPIIHGHND